MTDLRTAALRALYAWDTTPLLKAGDGMLQERMEDLRALAKPEDKAQAAFEHWLVEKLLTVTQAQVAHRAQRMRDAGYTRRPTLREMAEPAQATNFPEEKLQAIAEYLGDTYHVWYGIGARDVEEVLRQSVRRGLVTLNFDTGEQPEPEAVAVKQHDPNIHMVGPNDGGRVWIEELSPIPVGTKLYAAPPRREWREQCWYPDCVDNGPEGKCTRWLLAECSKSSDFKPHRSAKQENV